jgi:anthranilate synthase/phosphoribosyltransferase
MYLIIDNYDSFTYNLYQYFCEISDKEFKVVRNNRITVKEIEKIDPEGIIISPGPGNPDDGGISLETINHFKGKKPILGVCLGHQCIGQAFGGKIIQAGRIVHGKVEEIILDGKGLFRNIPSPSPFTRYHSLIIDPETMPDELEITARSKDGEIMGVRHKKYMIEGIQFHPESVESLAGKKLLKNFLNYKKESIEPKAILSRLMEKKDLSFEETAGFMEELTEGELNNSQIAAFLACLNVKGFKPEEIAGAVSILHKKKKGVASSKPVLDTCGTGGDGLGTFNISSMSALIASSCGAVVAKHGNRSVSSKSGSADFYGSLGINIALSPENAEKVLEKTGFTFLFAPLFHGAMKYAAPVRRELKLKTIMNCLGPLANPAEAEYQLIGVFDENLCVPIARAAKLLGIKRVMVVHSDDGQDEISVSSPTKIVEIRDNEEKEYIVKPEDFGINNYSLDELKGGTADTNAKLALSLLSGNSNGAIRDSVCLNAGAALYVYGIADDIKSGYIQAKEALESGKVKDKLFEIIQETGKYK